MEYLASLTFWAFARRQHTQPSPFRSSAVPACLPMLRSLCSELVPASVPQDDPPLLEAFQLRELPPKCNYGAEPLWADMEPTPRELGASQGQSRKPKRPPAGTRGHWGPSQPEAAKKLLGGMDARAPLLGLGRNLSLKDVLGKLRLRPLQKLDLTVPPELLEQARQSAEAESVPWPGPIRTLLSSR